MQDEFCLKVHIEETIYYLNASLLSFLWSFVMNCLIPILLFCFSLRLGIYLLFDLAYESGRVVSLGVDIFAYMVLVALDGTTRW